MAKYTVTGSVTIYLETEFEDNEEYELSDQAYDALQDEAIDKLGSYACEGDFELEGYIHA